MRRYATVLKAVAPICSAVATAHWFFKRGAAQMLGAVVSRETLATRQNHFNGVSFALYEVILCVSVRSCDGGTFHV